MKIIYNSSDFIALKMELEKYAVGGIVSTSGPKQWYIDNGGISDRYDDWTVSNPKKMEELQNKMKQYENWCHKVEYAKKKELEYLESIANSM